MVNGEKRLSVKEAIKKAAEFFKEVFETDAFRLEEVDLEGATWSVTFSRSLGIVSPIESMIGSNRTSRDYKVVKIDATTGEALSIKDR